MEEQLQRRRKCHCQRAFFLDFMLNDLYYKVINAIGILTECRRLRSLKIAMPRLFALYLKWPEYHFNRGAK